MKPIFFIASSKISIPPYPSLVVVDLAHVCSSLLREACGTQAHCVLPSVLAYLSISLMVFLLK